MKKTKSFYVSLAFALLIFTIPLIYVVFCKVNGYFIVPNLVIYYSAISLIAFGLASIFVFIKAIPGGIRVIFTSIILVCAFGFCFLCQGIGGNTEFDVYKGVEKIIAYNESLPPEDNYLYIETEGYGEFEDIVHYHYLSTGLFVQHSETKIIKYNDENFKKETERINAEMSFYEKAVDDSDPVPVFTVEGFDFRLEEIENHWYPKDMFFVGINKETKEIAYVKFYDDDLDSVWDFSELLYNDCGWKFIIKDRNK